MNCVNVVNIYGNCFPLHWPNREFGLKDTVLFRARQIASLSGCFLSYRVYFWYLVYAIPEHSGY